ncbi:MAG: dUTP diphosphatase [Helicobacteraceae bacterium]|nr:dUTP diphosphatase [Helicobacteraceae bacterium]
MIALYIKKLDSNARIPKYQTEEAAGFDLHALEDAEIAAGERALVRTGLAVAVPRGYELQVRPRSSLALKYGVTVLNTPGTVDSDYRGELLVILINLGRETYKINGGDRIAQAIVKTVEKVDLIEARELSDTMRGDGGFGSTGV